jgi:hypothetical protein
VEELFQHPQIDEHFAGREADAFSIDAILADLHEIGEVGLDVYREDDQVLYSCTLVLRSAEGSIVVTADSAMGAALGCLLETLLAMRDQTDRGIADIEEFLGER